MRPGTGRRDHTGRAERYGCRAANSLASLKEALDLGVVLIDVGRYLILAGGGAEWAHASGAAPEELVRADHACPGGGDKRARRHQPRQRLARAVGNDHFGLLAGGHCPHQPGQVGVVNIDGCHGGTPEATGPSLSLLGLCGGLGVSVGKR
ncbi:hypothetical protein CBM2597_U40003 [Cupriavidus taiwanensis]|nr:hypothetical protein CBM2597_U40003 [Cupriavidus taiwanensis]